MTEDIFEDKKGILMEYLGEGSRMFLINWEYVISYNGLEPCIWRIIEEWDKGNLDFQYSDIKELGNGYAFHQLQALHMGLVALYGDYGTSPRYGWIDNKNIPKVRLILEALADPICPKCGEEMREVWNLVTMDKGSFPHAYDCCNCECGHIIPIDLDEFRERCEVAFKKEEKE